MVILGVDSHKHSHTVVAVDGTGRKLAEKTVAATTRRPPRARPLGRAASASGRFALEDCRHLSRRLERDLLLAGEAVIRVSPKLMAGARRSSSRTRQERSHRRPGGRPGGAP